MFRKIILLTVVFSMYLMAADVFTLEDCLRIARENNAALKSAKVNRQMAEETEGSAFPAYFPKVFAGGFAFMANVNLVKKKIDESAKLQNVGQLPYQNQEREFPKGTDTRPIWS